MRGGCRLGLRVALQIGLEIGQALGVLDRRPGCRCRLSLLERGETLARGGGELALRIALEIGLEIGRALAVLERIPGRGGGRGLLECSYARGGGGGEFGVGMGRKIGRECRLVVALLERLPGRGLGRGLPEGVEPAARDRGKVALRIFLQIGLELDGLLAVLDRIPEGDLDLMVAGGICRDIAGGRAGGSRARLAAGASATAGEARGRRTHLLLAAMEEEKGDAGRGNRGGKPGQRQELAPRQACRPAGRLRMGRGARRRFRHLRGSRSGRDLLDEVGHELGAAAGGTATVPRGEVDRMDVEETQGGSRVVEAHRHQLALLERVAGLGAHPGRIDGVLRPGDDDDLGVGDGLLDDEIEGIARLDPPVPPHGEAGALEHRRQRLDPVLVLPRVADEEVARHSPGLAPPLPRAAFWGLSHASFELQCYRAEMAKTTGGAAAGGRRQAAAKSLAMRA